MSRYFPSRKVFIVGVLGIALLAWAISYQGTSQKNSAIKESVLVSVASAESVFPDIDNDGLYDWEETLYGTDKNNPDSDGNGIPDGKQYVSDKEDLGIRLSDSVYSAVYRLGEEVNNTPNPIDLLSTEPKNYKNPYGQYNLIYRNDSEEDRESYIVELFAALSAHAEIIDEDPLALAKEWLETKNPIVIEKISEINSETMRIAQSLIYIEVPPHYENEHLSIANNLYLSGLSLEELNVTTVDPMTGFFAVANYANYQSKYLETVNSLIGMDKIFEN